MIPHLIFILISPTQKTKHGSGMFLLYNKHNSLIPSLLPALPHWEAFKGVGNSLGSRSWSLQVMKNQMLCLVFACVTLPGQQLSL